MSSLVTRSLRSVCSTSNWPSAPSLIRRYAQRSWADEDEDDAPRRPRAAGPRAVPQPPRRAPMPRNPPAPPPPSEKELAKRAKMRVDRAERLERKDLTAQLTPTKTYMGGFTQPQHFAFLNPLDPTRKQKDSPSLRTSADRIRPAASSYEPHTVYLAVTRYPVKWPGHGRAVRRECFSGFCRADELDKEFRELNGGRWREGRTDWVKKEKGKQKEAVEVLPGWEARKESQEYIDCAVWPGSPQERTMLNKPIYAALKAQKRLKEEDSSPSALEDSVTPPFLPPVSRDWTAPFLPHLAPSSRPIVPLLTLTLPTRPLAATLARLCNSHPRGLSFVASVADADRKDGPAFFRRLLRMRADRMRDLSGELVSRLRGEGGGLFAVRLSAEDKGRGVEGERLGEDFKEPEGGWVELKWLRAESEVWEGIQRASLVSSWEGLEGVGRGDEFAEDGRGVGEEEQVKGRTEDTEFVSRMEAGEGREKADEA